MLLDKRTKLRRDIELREEEAAESRVDSPEIEDIAEGIVEDRNRVALLEHDRALLTEVEHALAKLDAGTYGRSEASGRPIPYARLQAVPWARLGAGEAARFEQAACR
jgi:DnaK suppressor protein